MDRYEFGYDNKNRLKCITKVDGETVSYIGEDARIILLQLAKDRYDDFYVDIDDKKKRKSGRRIPPKLRMKNDYNTVVFHDCYRNENTINKYFVKDKDKINKIMKKNNTFEKKAIAVGVSVVLALSGATGLLLANNEGVKLDKDTSKTHDGKKIESISEEKNDKNTLKVGNDVYEVEDTTFTYDDYTNTPKYLEVKSKYENLCNEIGTKYGVSPELLLAMITQESGGIFSNLMQVEFYNCDDEVLTVDNFVTGEKDSFVLTTDKTKYDSSITAIDPDMFEDSYYNVTIGCVLLQKVAKDLDYNVAMAIQGYNYGIGNMHTILNNASKDLGVSVESLIADKEGKSWLKYRNIKAGDPNYLENVGRYLKDGIDSVHINTFNGSHQMRVGK